MKHIVEFSLFAAFATVSHLAFFQALPTRDIYEVDESDGRDVSLAAGSAALASLVTRWEKPVSVVAHIAPPQPPSLPTVAVLDRPASQQPDMSTPMLSRPIAPTEDALPEVDYSIPAPSLQATKNSARPRVRPTPEPLKQKVAPNIQSKPATTAPSKGKATKSSPQKSRAKSEKSSGRSQKTDTSAKAAWGNSIRAAIERRKRYPAGTRNRGTVLLTVSVSSNGALSSVSISKSSGDPGLDRAAVTAVKRARFQTAPSGVAAGVHRFSLPVSFRP